VIFGGGQERGLRAGTLATHQIVGFAAACTLARQQGDEVRRGEMLRERLWSRLTALGGAHLNGEGAPRAAEILSVSFEGVDGESLVTGLTELAVATGSACSSASAEPSYVLRALGRSSALAQSTLRLSLGRATTEADIDRAAGAVSREVRRLRAASPAAISANIAADDSRIDANEVKIGLDILGRETRQLFTSLPGAGTLQGPGVVSGEAGSAAAEAWVRFHARIAGGSVRDARFQAHGCPHTLAVAAWITTRLPGRALRSVALGEPADWARALEVPVEKLGRLLVVEDALQACLRCAEKVVE
jgi:cysteine desulfurase